MAASEKGVVELVERAENPNGTENGNLLQTMWLTARRNPKDVLYAVMMASGPMAFGFDIVIVGVVTAIPAFLLVPPPRNVPVTSLINILGKPSVSCMVNN